LAILSTLQCIIGLFIAALVGLCGTRSIPRFGGRRTIQYTARCGARFIASCIMPDTVRWCGGFMVKDVRCIMRFGG
jgi:hypothetical protein